MTKLRAARKKRLLARKEVAEKLNISCDHLSRLERGDSALSIIQICKLSKIYNIPIETMLEIALEAIKENGEHHDKRIL